MFMVPFSKGWFMMKYTSWAWTLLTPECYYLKKKKKHFLKYIDFAFSRLNSQIHLTPPWALKFEISEYVWVG